MVSRKHTKGILTLSLLLLAESVSFANAASFWNILQNVDNINGHASSSSSSNGHGHGHGSSSSSSSKASTKGAFAASVSCSTPLAADGSCPAPLSNKMRMPLAGIFQRSRRSLSSSSSSNRATSTSTSTSTSSSTTAVRSMTKESHNSYACVENAVSAGTGNRQCQQMTSIPRGGHIGMQEQVLTAAMEGAASASSATTPYGIPLNGWKVIFQAILTAINVVFWLVPLRSKKMTENKLALSLANAFSGGVFLSLAFGHLIPECVHGFGEISTNLPATTPFLLVLAGYLLIFFVEKVAFDAHDMLPEMEQEHENKDSTSTSTSTTTTTTTTSTSTSVSTTDAAANGHATGHVVNRGRSAVILLGALAVHSILEMMALGLSDSFGDCALLSLSIALHQPAESIALLVAFLKSGMPKPQIVQFLSVFSCMGPIGVALGMAVNEFAPPIFDSIMLAIVAGTFVYVGATEVIPEEWEDPTNKWKKFAALMSGIVSILVITQYTMALGV